MKAKTDRGNSLPTTPSVSPEEVQGIGVVFISVVAVALCALAVEVIAAKQKVTLKRLFS